MSNPVKVVRYFDVDARYSALTATNSPADDTDYLPGTASLTDHWTTAVALAGILSFLSSGTDETRMQFEVVAQSRLLQLSLALVVGDDGHVDFL